jgi:hypothetical protein
VKDSKRIRKESNKAGSPRKTNHGKNLAGSFRSRVQTIDRSIAKQREKLTGSVDFNIKRFQKVDGQAFGKSTTGNQESNGIISGTHEEFRTVRSCGRQNFMMLMKSFSPEQQKEFGENAVKKGLRDEKTGHL